MLYSPSTKGFYDPLINDVIPEDVVEISDEEYQQKLSTLTDVTTAILPVSPRQIRQALTKVGLRQNIETAIAAGDQDLKDWWEFSTAFERHNPLVVQMGAAMNQTPEQLDQLWLLAGSL